MTTALDSAILTLVTFIPLTGGLLLLLVPRRDRDIRIFSLVVTLLTFPIFTTTWEWMASRYGWSY